MSSLYVWCPLSVSLKFMHYKSYQGIGLGEVVMLVLWLSFLNMGIKSLEGLEMDVRLMVGLRFHT